MVVILVLDTAFRQHTLRQSQLIVGIGEEQRVSVANGAVVILLVYTCTIGIGLV